MMIVATAPMVGPSFPGLLFCAGLWVMAMLIVLCHRSGIQIVGALMALVGFIEFFLQTNLLVAVPLFASGCAIHWFGRILHHLRHKP